MIDQNIMPDTTIGMPVIYGLACPTSGEIRYIGKANNPVARFNSHVSRALTRNEAHYSAKWIRSLLRDGLRPQLIVLERLGPHDDWREAERRHIANARDCGVRLTNIAPGGEGVVLSADGRLRISAKNKRRWSDPEYASRCKSSLSKALKHKHRTDRDYARRCAEGARRAWKKKKEEESYLIDKVRVFVSQHLGNILKFDEVRSAFPGPARTSISRVISELSQEGAIEVLGEGLYARDIKNPYAVGVQVLESYGFSLCEEDFEVGKQKSVLRVRSKINGTFERPVKIGDQWLRLKAEARGRLRRESIQVARSDPAWRAAASERAKFIAAAKRGRDGKDANK